MENNNSNNNNSQGTNQGNQQQGSSPATVNTISQRPNIPTTNAFFLNSLFLQKNH